MGLSNPTSLMQPMGKVGEALLLATPGKLRPVPELGQSLPPRPLSALPWPNSAPAEEGAPPPGFQDPGVGRGLSERAGRLIHYRCSPGMPSLEQLHLAVNSSLVSEQQGPSAVA